MNLNASIYAHVTQTHTLIHKYKHRYICKYEYVDGYFLACTFELKTKLSRFKGFWATKLYVSL